MTLKRIISVLAVASCLGAAPACSKPSADDHIARGDDFKQRNMLPEAIIEYRTAIQIEPQRGDVRLKLADIFMETRDGSAALREYVRAADLLPKDVKAQIKAGTLLLMAGAFEDAQSRARNALDLEAGNGEALILLANAKAGLKDLDGALSQYQEAIALNPTDRTFYGMGTIQLARGETAEAEASFRKAVDVAPKSLMARLALANFLWASSRQDEAEKEFKAALEIEPENPLANRALGMFYMNANRAAEAEPHFKAIAASSSSPDATIALADYYVITKRIPEARKVLDDLARTDKHWAQATTRLAAIDAMEGFRAQGTDRLRAVLEKQPNERAAQLLLARLLLADGKREEAMKEASAIVQAEPTGSQTADAYMVIAQIHTMLDRREEAIKALNEVLSRHRQPINAQLALATFYLAQLETDKAMSFVNQALALQPKHPYARALKVRVLLAERKTTEARTELAALQKEYPDAPPVQNLLAAEQIATGQLAAARTHYAKAAAAAPANTEALAGLVRLDLAAGKLADARARVNQAIKLNGNDVDLLILSAQVSAAERKLDETEDTLRKVVDLDPARLRGYAMLAQLYLAQNRLIEAERQFQAVLERNPSSIGTATMLGMLYEMRGKNADAEKQYEKVLALDSSAAVAANNLAFIYADQNRNLDQALTLAQTAHRRLSNDPNVIDTLGWVYYRKGMTSAAIRELEAAVKGSPKNAQLRYHLGMAYNQAGQLGKARSELTEALAMSPSFAGADEARKTLQVIGGSFQ